MTDTQATPDPTAGFPVFDAPPTSGTPQAPDPASPSPSRPRPGRRGVEVLVAIVAIFAVAAVGFAVGRGTAHATTAQAGFRGTVQPPNVRQFPNGGQLPNGQRGFGGNGQMGGGFGGNGQRGNGQMGGGFGGNGQMGGGFGQGGFAGSGLGVTLSGQVTEITTDHLTLKLANGQTIQLALDGTTTYHTQAAATAADVTTGSTVQVQVTRAGVGIGGGTGNGGTVRLGQATSVTVVPK